jgi:hypothetical protein
MGMGWWQRAKPVVETAEHLHLGATLLDLAFDWRVWVSAAGGGVVTLFTAAYDGRSVTDVLLAVALGIAIFALSAAGIITLVKRIRSPAVQAIAPATQIESVNGAPDVRVADDLIVWGLFESSDRDKLFPLLEDGKVQAWGRLGNGFPPLMKIPQDLWRTNYIIRIAEPLVPGRINQTFLKTKSRHESSYYDVCLNHAQLKNYWPKLGEPISLYEAASLAYGETRGTVISGMAEQRSDSPLFWYVFHFFVISEIPIYGNVKFSPKRERVPTIRGFTPELRDNQIILKDIYGNKDWENLTIDPADLTKDFEGLRKTASEVPK